MCILPRSPGAVTFKAASPPLSAPSTLTARQQAECIEFALAFLPKCSPGLPLGSSATSGLHSPFRSSLWRLRLALPCALSLGPNASDFAAALTLSATPANSTPEVRMAIPYVVALNCVQDSKLQVPNFLILVTILTVCWVTKKNYSE